MDREIPKKVQLKERKKKIIRIGLIGVTAIILIVSLISFMRAGVDRKKLFFLQLIKVE